MSDNTDNLFIVATKRKYRFPSSAGHLTLEDLWDLPLSAKGAQVSLNTVAKQLYKALNENEVDFVEDKKTQDTILQRKFDIVKYIIESKKADKEKAQKAKDTRERRQKIMEIMEKKKDESLENLDMEELQKLLDQES